MKNKIVDIIKNNKKAIIINFLIIIIINLITNFNFIVSLFNPTEQKIYDANSFVIGDDSYEIVDINSEIGMLKLNFDSIPDSLEISYTSDGFEKYKHVNSNYYNKTIMDNEVIVLVHIDGNVNSLKLDVLDAKIDSIVINPDIGYKFNFIYTFIYLILLVFIKYIFKRNDKLNLSDMWQKTIISWVLIIFISVILGFYISKIKTSYHFGDIYEFYYVDAVLDGRLDLNFPVNDYLKYASNPYDSSNREYEFLWDASYYNGKYYCYFGILPIIVLMVPFKLLTNIYLSTPSVCLFYAILGVFATFLLYNKIINKYFKKINFQTYLISLIFILLGSKLLWCMHNPNFYELLCLASYFHVILGLYLVLFFDKKSLNFIGYLTLALAVLCRPTSLLYSFLIVPKLLKKFMDKDMGIWDYVILVVPYLVVGLFTMYLNYIRFDSIFEFGISYQLTTNNLNLHSFSLFNGIFGLISYLFSGIDINIFPFRLVNPEIFLPIVSDFHIENIGGGVITTSILGFIILFIPKIFKYIKEKELKVYIILSLVVALVIIVLSSGVGALIGRYMLDFNFVFYFITVILCLYVLKVNRYNWKLNNIYYICLMISIFINLLMSVTNK